MRIAAIIAVLTLLTGCAGLEQRVAFVNCTNACGQGQHECIKSCLQIYGVCK